MKKMFLLLTLAIIVATTSFAAEYTYSDLHSEIDFRSLQTVYPDDIFYLDDITDGTGNIKMFVVYLGEYAGQFQKDGFNLEMIYSGSRFSSAGSGYTDFYVFLN